MAVKSPDSWWLHAHELKAGWMWGEERWMITSRLKKVIVLWAVTLIADSMEKSLALKWVLEIQLDLKIFCKANFLFQNVLGFIMSPLTPQYLFCNLCDAYFLQQEMIIWLFFFCSLCQKGIQHAHTSVRCFGCTYALLLLCSAIAATKYAHFREF